MQILTLIVAYHLTSKRTKKFAFFVQTNWTTLHNENFSKLSKTENFTPRFAL